LRALRACGPQAGCICPSVPVFWSRHPNAVKSVGLICRRLASARSKVPHAPVLRVSRSRRKGAIVADLQALIRAADAAGLFVYGVRAKAAA
jgi:hypothetical protein